MIRKMQNFKELILKLRDRSDEQFPVQHIAWKRIFDITFSLFALFLLSPLLLLIALLVKVSSKGPIFYKCRRVGRGNRIIYCLKFRTMYIDADEKLNSLLQNATFKEEWEQYRKLKNDPRITPLGKLLRKTSLDELPQFWNALRGDLSIVGPRPITEHEIGVYVGEKAPKILSIRPGLTGVMQVSGRSSLTMQERVTLEEKYVESRSFAKDLLIILKTIPQLFFSKGAY